MLPLPALIEVDPEKGSQDTNTDADSEESFKVKVWHIRVMHPRLEPVVHFLARWWWPWSYTLLIVAMALAIIFDRPGVAVGFSLAQAVWVSPFYLCLDVRKWRVLLTPQNLLVATLSSLNLACIIALAVKESNWQAHWLSSFVFVLVSAVMVLFQIADHDVCGFVESVPWFVLLDLVAVYLFIVRGDFFL